MAISQTLYASGQKIIPSFKRHGGQGKRTLNRPKKSGGMFHLIKNETDWQSKPTYSLVKLPIALTDLQREVTSVNVGALKIT